MVVLSLATLLLLSSTCTLCPNGAAPQRVNQTVVIPDNVANWMTRVANAATAASFDDNSTSLQLLSSSLPRVTCRELAEDFMFVASSDDDGNKGDAGAVGAAEVVVTASTVTPGSLWACSILQTLFAEPCGCPQAWTCDFESDPCSYQGDGICRDYYKSVGSSSSIDDDDSSGGPTPSPTDDDKGGDNHDDDDDSSSSTGKRQSKVSGSSTSGSSNDDDNVGSNVMDDDATFADDTATCTSVRADCYDCDPCRQYSFTSCETCTAAQLSIASSSSFSVARPHAQRGGDTVTSNDIKDDDADGPGSSSHRRSGTSSPRPACLWCPGDAMCSSYPYARFQPAGANGTCASDRDWIHRPETCPSHHYSDDDSNATHTSAGPNNGTSSTGRESEPPTTSEKDSSSSSSREPKSEELLFNDPLLDSQRWIFDMIHVWEVWEQNITGAGVTIRINDDGIDSTHPEFSASFSVNRSCKSYEYIDVAEDWHGTAVASIAVGHANNDHCGVGVAYGATLSACKTMGTTGTEVPLPQALTIKLELQDISSNSMGYSACALTKTQETTGTGSRLLQDACPFRPGPSELPCSACGLGDVGNSGSSTTSKQGTSDRSNSSDGKNNDNSNSDDRGLWYREDNASMADACLQAIVDYCSIRLNYEQDDSTCVHFLERFTSCHFNGLSEDYQTQLERGVTQGRKGKGLIFVYAGGNDYSLGGYTNFEGLGNSRYVISVGAVDKFGFHASYSTPGASVFLAAPGGDTDVQTGVVAAALGGTCGNVGAGTSFATPVVSGVVALMLEVNPTLSWRDVQGVLAKTSRHVDTTDPSWTTNAAGYSHSYKYGFGIVHALDAVNAARSWQNWGNESVLSGFSGVIKEALDDDDAVGGAQGGGGGSSSSGAHSTMKIKGNMTLESVVVYVDVHHSSRGHLQIKLTSPHGTESILTPGERPENTQSSSKVRWKVMTLRSWGESSAGTWTISLVDTDSGDIGGDCVDQAFDDDSSLDYDCYRVYEELSFQGSTPESACQDAVLAEKCCFCGGGTPRSSFNNSLVSWTMVMYGHDLETDLLHPDTSSDDAPDYGSSAENNSNTSSKVNGDKSNESTRSQEHEDGSEAMTPLSSTNAMNESNLPVPELLFGPALPIDPSASGWDQSSQERWGCVGFHGHISLGIVLGALLLLM